jgi:hypothetical protein
VEIQNGDVSLNRTPVPNPETDGGSDAHHSLPKRPIFGAGSFFVLRHFNQPRQRIVIWKEGTPRKRRLARAVVGQERSRSRLRDRTSQYTFSLGPPLLLVCRDAAFDAKLI